MQLTIPINATIKYIDFEGVSDGNSLKTTFEQVAPRSAIFVRGTPEALDEMKRFATERVGVARVHVPDVGQTVDATSETQMYGFAMDAALKGSLRWAVADDYEIAYCQARVGAIETVDGSERRVLTAPSGLSDDPWDVDMTEGDGPSDETRAMREEEARSHRSVFVGRPQLKDIKSALDKKGFRAEFQQGVLVVNDVVTVRKDAPDASGVPVLRVEGGFCPDYFAVRDVVYGKFDKL